MTETHISTKDRPGDYDGMETAKTGEPVFTLQGGDPLGALTVIFWAWKARQLARTLDDGKDRERLQRRASAAEEVAWAMRAYRNGEQKQPGERASYNDQPAPDAPASTEDQIAERAALITSVGHLNNAAAIAKSVSETLVGLGPQHFEADAKINAAIMLLQAAAEDIEPRRGNERS